MALFVNSEVVCVVWLSVLHALALFGLRALQCCTVKLKLKCVLPNYYRWCDALVQYILLRPLHSILSLNKGVM